MTVSILVVDDEPDVAELFRQRFRREARQGTYVMHFASSGEDILRGDGFPLLFAGLQSLIQRHVGLWQLPHCAEGHKPVHFRSAAGTRYVGQGSSAAL